MVLKRDVIAIINSRAKQSPSTKEFIEIAKDEDFVKNISNQEKEKSFVITTKEIYLSPISCSTLKKRCEISSLSESV